MLIEGKIRIVFKKEGSKEEKKDMVEQVFRWDLLQRGKKEHYKVMDIFYILITVVFT